MATEEKRPESNSCDQNRGGEDWDNEAASATLQNFTLKCTISTPLSLMDEDVSYTPLGNMIRKPSDSPFEIITLPASDSFHPLWDYSSLPEE